VSSIFAIERPNPKLWTYYLICCLAAGPLFPILILPHWFRYRTMRFRFDAEGISMRWGILFRREVLLNYARIQDIHLVSNVVERWLGLARIQIQTASGSSAPEMTIEGVMEFEAVRDFLYSRMRGIAEKSGRSEVRTGAGLPAGGAVSGTLEGSELVVALQAVTSELRAIRETLEKTKLP